MIDKTVVFKTLIMSFLIGLLVSFFLLFFSLKFLAWISLHTSANLPMYIIPMILSLISLYFFRNNITWAIGLILGIMIGYFSLSFLHSALFANAILKQYA